MSAQWPEPPAETGSNPRQWHGPAGTGQWLDPGWADSQELWPAPAAFGQDAPPAGDGMAGDGADPWPGEPAWPARGQWAPQDEHTAHEPRPVPGYPTGAQPPVPGYPTGAQPPVPGYPTGAQPPVPGYPTGTQPPVPAARRQWAANECSSPSSAWAGVPGAQPAQPGYRDQPGAPQPRPAAAAQASSRDLRWAMIAYLAVPFFSFLVPLAVYLGSRRSSLSRTHAAQAANTAFTVLLYEVSAAIIATTLALDTPAVAVAVTGPLLAGLWLVSLVYLARAASAAGRGAGFRMPAWLCATVLR